MSLQSEFVMSFMLKYKKLFKFCSIMHCILLALPFAKSQSNAEVAIIKNQK